jgi:hypothetical protein
MIRIFFFTVFIISIVYGDEFTRTDELDSLTIKKENLIKISNELYSYVKENNNLNNSVVMGTLKLDQKAEGKNSVTELSFPINQEDISKFPDRAYSASIFIATRIKLDSRRLIIAPDAKTSILSIDLSDYNNEISVKGNDLDNVVGLLNIVKEKFKKYETSFTGKDFRFILFFISTLILLVIVALLKDSIKTIVIICYILTIIYIDWEKHFPGFISNIEGVRPIDIKYLIVTIITTIILPFIMNKYSNKFNLLNKANSQVKLEN